MPRLVKLLRNSALLLTSAFFFACESDTNIGLDLNDNPTGVFFTDTLSVSSGTYLMDSVITSGQNFTLVGVSNDPLLGKAQAVSFLQPTLEFTNQNQQGYFNFEYTSEILPDSVVLRFWNRSLTYFGDSTSKVTFNVHRLSGEFPSRNFNNDDALAYESAPLASVTFNLEDLKGDSSAIVPLRIKLPNSILEELNAIRNTDDGITLAAFEKKFRGFALVPDANASAMYAFNTGQSDGSASSPPVSSMDYFFHNPGDTIAVVYNFEFRSGRFHQIKVDRSGTALANLTNKKQVLPLKESNNELFVQAGSGTAAFATFPGLKNIRKGSTIAKAEMVFKVNKDAFSQDFNIAPFLVPIESRNDGSVRRDQTFGYSYIANVLNQSTGNLGFYNDSLGTIRVDITPYIRELVLKNSPDNGIIFAAGSTVSTSTSTGTGIVFNGGLNRIILSEPKLELLYSN